MGQTASLNKGLAIARGEYIARLDQDDVNLPKRLEEQYDFLKERKDIAIVCSWEHTIDSTGKLVRDWKKSIENYGVFIGEILLALCPIWHPSVMFRKSDVTRLQGFDTAYGPAEDYELWSRLALARFNAWIVPEFHLLQRVHNQRQSHLQAERQLTSTQRAHQKAINYFLSNEAESQEVSLFLQLKKKASGESYSRADLIRISENIKKIIEIAASKQQMTAQELSSLKKILTRRIGAGYLVAGRIKFLSPVLFKAIFYLVSPLSVGNIKQTLSALNVKLKKVRYFLKNSFY
jgi:glycosyltransferase involved in cell wall biosynthesis